MSDTKKESSEALHRLVINTAIADWIREQALQELINREELEILERIVKNTGIADWIREKALNGIKRMK